MSLFKDYIKLRIASAVISRDIAEKLNRNDFVHTPVINNNFSENPYYESLIQPATIKQNVTDKLNYVSFIKNPGEDILTNIPISQIKRNKKNKMIKFIKKILKCESVKTTGREGVFFLHSPSKNPDLKVAVVK